MYHRVVPAVPAHDPFRNCVSTRTFETHLKWLYARGYQSVPLADLDRSLSPATNDWRTLPSKSVVITFDDGYRDNYLYAWPILKRYGYTATIFVVADAIGGDNSFDAAYRSDPAPILSVAEMREMHRDHIGFGSHTCSHPSSMTSLSEAQLKDELERSRSVISGVLDAPVEHFAYPHSRLDDRVEAAVERAGYRLACAGVGTRFSRYCLQRVEASARSGAGLQAQVAVRQLKYAIRHTRLGLSGASAA